MCKILKAISFTSVKKFLKPFIFQRKVSELFQDFKSTVTGHLHLEISDPTNKGPDPQH